MVSPKILPELPPQTLAFAAHIEAVLKHQASGQPR